MYLCITRKIFIKETLLRRLLCFNMFLYTAGKLFLLYAKKNIATLQKYTQKLKNSRVCHYEYFIMGRESVDITKRRFRR